MTSLFLICAVAAAVLCVMLLREKLHSRDLESEFERIRAGNLSSDHFLNGMFQEMRSGRGLSGAMHLTAEYLAEQCNAESAVIFEVAGGRLNPLGMSGSFPLVRNVTHLLLTHHRHLFENLRRENIRLGRDFLGCAAESANAELIANAAADSRLAGYPGEFIKGSLMTMPMQSSGKAVGLACVFGNRDKPGESFSPEQFSVLQLLAPQLTIALDLVHAYGEISRQERIDQELVFARQIQFSLLPDTIPSWSQFAVTAFTRSAKEVNGDFYDFVEIDKDRLLVVIGDACGKGVPACMLSAMTRSVIRAMADNFVSLGDFLHDMNKKLYRGTDADRFITLGCCLLDRKNSLIEFGRAGHTELLTYVHNHIRAIAPDGAALGILPDDLAEFDTFCMSFEPGMALLLYSDGLTEATDAKGVEFGLPRLKELFRIACFNGGSAKSVIDLLLEEVGSYEEEQGDDQTLILIKHTLPEDTGRNTVTA